MLNTSTGTTTAVRVLQSTSIYVRVYTWYTNYYEESAVLPAPVTSDIGLPPSGNGCPSSQYSNENASAPSPGPLVAVEKSPEAIAVAIQEFLGENRDPTLTPRHEYGEVRYDVIRYDTI